jgi:hypothetical protein
LRVQPSGFTVSGGVKPPSPRLLGKEILRLQADRDDHVVEDAVREALEQDAAVVALRDAEARIPIIVGGAEGHEVTVVRLDALQALQDAIEGPHPALVRGFGLMYNPTESFLALAV